MLYEGSPGTHPGPDGQLSSSPPATYDYRGPSHLSKQGFVLSVSRIADTHHDAGVA